MDDLAALLDDPLRPRDRVALLVPGSASYVELVAALLRRGVFPVPLDPALTAAERTRLVDPLRPRLVLTRPPEVDALLAHLAAHHPPLDEPPVLRGRPMHTTSGTTGVPKAVDSGLLTADQGAALVAEERDLWGFRADDVNLVVSPLHHSAPLRFGLGTLLAGGRLVVPGPFDVVALTAAITEQRPTTMFVVPTHLQRLFRHWDEVGVPDLSCFRLVAHAGAPCPPAVKARLVELFPPGSTWEFYGSTEGQFTACASEDERLRPGTVGRARPGRTLHLDDDGTIWCTVPEHARFTYVDQPERTAAAWRDTPAGPAFTVGDAGRMDDDGWLWLDGRRSDLVITGGVNVYPLEVENVLREHPGVEDVAVHGRPDPEWGQRVVATVVASTQGVDVEELRAWARERLAPAKRPKDYAVVDDLPRTATGKVRRDALPGD